MIITHIIGGLGNQMFQYAAGRALALSTGQQLKLDISEMSGYGRRRYGLDQFTIQADIATPAEIPRKPSVGLFSRIAAGFRIGAADMPRIVELSSAFNSEMQSLRGPAHISGYWQSEKYFVSFADVIRKEFTLVNSLQPIRRSILEQICTARHPVSLHVRRGDYVTNPSANAVHGTCEPEWYRTAMERMSTLYDVPTFFVFSDDPGWARENLPRCHAMTFVEPQTDGRDGEDMHLMAACRSHIIANSTFSWWGAWLNPRTDKRVIAPAMWFRSSDLDARDIVPEDWERL